MDHWILFVNSKKRTGRMFDINYEIMSYYLK